MEWDTALMFKIRRKGIFITMKRWLSLLMVIMLCFSLTAPAAQVDASSRVTVVYKGKTKSFGNKKTYAYVNNEKIKAVKQPIFIKNGSYMGPVNKLFKKSSLKVKVTSSENTLTLQYRSNVVVLKNGSRNVTTNGEVSRMLAPAMLVTYPSGKTKWVVPLNSVCSCLGITYKLKNGVIRMKGAANTATTSSSSTTVPETPQQNGQITLVLDAGHVGMDSGATGNGFREKNMTLQILLGAKRMFDNDSRFKVYYTRTSDTYPSLTDRSKLANDYGADLFVSIHINSASASAHGTETLYNSSRNVVTAKNGMTSRELATYIQQSVVATTGFTNRGLKNRTDLSVLNRTTMPACLIEYGFISNAKESREMNANTTRYGQELYQAIVGYLQSEGKL